MGNPVCRLIRRRLDAFQDGELGAARTWTAAHLARCSGCAGELTALRRLRASLTSRAPEPAEAVWEAFWPQVRARIAAAPVEEVPARRWRPSAGAWGSWRLAFGSAVAAALAVVLVVAPWQREPDRPDPSGSARPGIPATRAVVVESIETADPQSSVMVFTNPESQVTVVWVFGLEPTDI